MRAEIAPDTPNRAPLGSLLGVSVVAVLILAITLGMDVFAVSIGLGSKHCGNICWRALTRSWNIFWGGADVNAVELTPLSHSPPSSTRGHKLPEIRT